MKFTKLSLIAAVAVSAITTSAMAEVGISANVSATNNYVWRGMTQSANGAAVQGGLDVDMNGFYAGTWLSNISPGTETDLYAGYSAEYEGVEYNLGYINYVYTQNTFSDFEEVYFGLSKDFGVASLGATYSKGLASSPDDIAIDAAIPVMQDYSLDLGYGDYNTVGTRYSVGVSKSFDKVDFSLGYSNFNGVTLANEEAVIVSAGTSF